MQSFKLVSQNIAFERNNQVLFEQVNFALESGQSLQIIGANGCGKSTLLRILAGFIDCQTGAVLWQDQSIQVCNDSYQAQLHYLGHQNGIQPALTVEENLHLTCALLSQKIMSPDYLDTILGSLNLSDLANTQALYLSAGQARRLALAKLLIKPAALWLLDEPATALDIKGQEWLSTLLNQHLAKGNIAIIATHQTLQLAGHMQRIELGAALHE